MNTYKKKGWEHRRKYKLTNHTKGKKRKGTEGSTGQTEGDRQTDRQTGNLRYGEKVQMNSRLPLYVIQLGYKYHILPMIMIQD